MYIWAALLPTYVFASMLSQPHSELMTDCAVSRVLPAYKKQDKLAVHIMIAAFLKNQQKLWGWELKIPLIFPIITLPCWLSIPVTTLKNCCKTDLCTPFVLAKRCPSLSQARHVTPNSHVQPEENKRRCNAANRHCYLFVCNTTGHKTNTDCDWFRNTVFRWAATTATLSNYE